MGMKVLAIIPVQDKILRKTMLEVFSYGSHLAESAGGSFSALIIGALGDGEIQRLGTMGSAKVFHAQGEWTTLLDNQAWTHVITEAAISTGAEILVFPDNSMGKALAPAVSASLDAGFIAGVDGLPIQSQPLTFKRKAFSGKAFAEVRLNGSLGVITLSINSFGLQEKAGSLNIEAWEPQRVGSSGISLVERKVASGKLLMSEADIIVSGGRGMKGPDNWAPLEALANTLGAATACSRPVSDEGWRPHEEHVGQTGKVVAPNLYIACGISGAVQHLAGISSSKVLVAINKDPDAPIFSAADYGIVGDVQDFLPKLNAAMKQWLDQ